MKASMKKKRGVVGAIVLAGILSVGGYALTNTLTFANKTVAGIGEQAVDVVDVQSTAWTLNSADQTKVSQVVFTFTSVTFGSGGADAWVNNKSATTANASSWTQCTAIPAGAQTSVTCPVTWDVKDIGASAAGTFGVVGTNATQGTLDNISLVVAEK